jgi:hypothetical protein
MRFLAARIPRSHRAECVLMPETRFLVARTRFLAVEMRFLAEREERESSKPVGVRRECREVKNRHSDVF